MNGINDRQVNAIVRFSFPLTLSMHSLDDIVNDEFNDHDVNTDNVNI